MTLREYVNSKLSTKIAMESLGIKVTEGSCFCEFHRDREGGKKSAKYYADGDFIMCFSERKTFQAFDVLTVLAGVSEKDLYSWAINDGWSPGGKEFLVKNVVLSDAFLSRVFLYKLGKLKFLEIVKDFKNEVLK